MVSRTPGRMLLSLRRCGDPRLPRLGPSEASERLPLIGWNLEALGKQVDHLLGWAPLGRFELFYGGEGAINTQGKIFLCEVEDATPLFQPTSER